ncbi:hypothetical protein D9M72_443380 [compost metagenome]
MHARDGHSNVLAENLLSFRHYGCLRRPHRNVGQQQPAGTGGHSGLTGALAGQVDVLDVVVAAFLEGCLAQEQVGVFRGLLQS